MSIDLNVALRVRSKKEELCSALLMLCITINGLKSVAFYIEQKVIGDCMFSQESVTHYTLPALLKLRSRTPDDG